MAKRTQKSDAERLNDLESTLAHQQREYEVLNQVVVEQVETIERLVRRIELLETNLKGMESQVLEERDPLDEKPPHY